MSFADGLRQMSERGAFVSKVRINKAAKQALREQFEETLSRTIDIETEEEHDLLMRSISWMKRQIGDEAPKIILNKRIGLWVYYWIGDFKYEPEGSDLDVGLKWMMNKVSSRYSLNEMI